MQLMIPFNSIGGDRVYNANDIARMFAALLMNGVHPMPGDCLMVFAGEGLELTLSPGTCVINGRLGVNQDAVSLTLAAADAKLPRIDSIVLRLNMETRDITERVLTGTPSSTPSPAPISRDGDVYDICVAHVLVAPNMSSVTQSAITDTRHDASLCGIVTSLIEADATNLFAQYDAAFSEWFAGISDALDENDAAQLAHQIGLLSGRINALERRMTKGVMEVERVNLEVDVSEWSENAELGVWQADVACASLTRDFDVIVCVAPECLKVPLAGVGEVLDGALRVYAPVKPEQNVAFTAIIQQVGGE